MTHLPFISSSFKYRLSSTNFKYGICLKVIKFKCCNEDKSTWGESIVENQGKNWAVIACINFRKCRCPWSQTADGTFWQDSILNCPAFPKADSWILVIYDFSLVSTVFFFFLHLSLIFFFYWSIELIYNVVPISAVQQSDSVIHIYSFFNYYFPLWFIPGDWI